jgi:DNA-binding CsgD family transcriptional regulator
MGLSPAELAGYKQVKVSTVRTQLHRIFEKTNTRNQAQLVRLIAENIAWYRL